MTTLSPPPGFGFPSLKSPPQPRQQTPPHHPRQQSPPQAQVETQKRSLKKRVSWVNGDSLCQVRLFVAEDAPGMSGSAQDQLQAKPTRNLHIFNPSIPAPAPDAPPGFGGVPVKSQSDHLAIAAIVPQISWRPPSKVHLDPTWHVVAGGASLETGLQKQREVRILEAVYPRPSTIPESPAEPVEAQEPYDDSKTPQIPLVPLEEEDTPDGSDMSNLPGTRFPSQIPSGQVRGVQTMSLSNGRQEKVKQYFGNNLPVPMQEISNARKDPTWGNATVGSTATRLLDHSSNVMSGRPPPPVGPLPDAHTNSKENSLQPGVASAAAAAIAALSKSQEMSSMIDNDLLLQILNDPSLIHTLQAKLPFGITTNLKPELSSTMSNVNGVSRGLDSMNHLNGVASRGPDSMNHMNGVSRGPDGTNHLNGVSRGPDNMNPNGFSRGPDKINQGQVMNGALGRANQWINPPSTSYMPVPAAGGQDGSRARSSESHINAGERFLRPQRPEERVLTLLPGAVGDGHLHTDFTNGGRGIGLGQLPRPSSQSSDFPRQGLISGSKANANGILPSIGASKSAPQLGVQTAVAPPSGSQSSRPLSRIDEQYFKSLIMQHGSANGDDLGRAIIIDKGSTGGRSGNVYSAPDTQKWHGREQLDSGRPERNGREQLDSGRSERNGRDRQDNERPGVDTSHGRGKSRKLCIYFGTSRGCRNGDKCSFVHELSEAEKRTDRARSASITQVPHAKRLKVDG